MATTVIQGAGRYPGVPRMSVGTRACLYMNIVNMAPDPDNPDVIILTTERDHKHRIRRDAMVKINGKEVRA